MPDMSGFELSREVKKIKPDIPIILLTGYSAIINKDETKQIGIYTILTKPIHLSNFSHAVRDAMDMNGSAQNL